MGGTDLWAGTPSGSVGWHPIRICGLAPYITLEEARKERQEEERNEQRRAKWGDRLGSAALRAHKRARIAGKEETDDAVKAAAMRARHVIPLAMWFEPALERDVTRQTRLVALSLILQISRLHSHF